MLNVNALKNMTYLSRHTLYRNVSDEIIHLPEQGLYSV